MPFLRDELLPYIRLRLGRVDPTLELTDNEFETLMLPKIIRSFSNIIPRKGFHQLALTTGEHCYALPDPYINHIIAWSLQERSPDISDDVLGPDFITPTRFNEVLSPVIGAYNRKLIRSYTVESVMIRGGQVEVLPTPETAFTIYLDTQDIWNFSADPQLDTLPFMYRNGFCALATAEAAGIMAQDVSKFSVIEVGTSRIVLNADRLWRLVDDAKREAQMELGKDGEAMTIKWG